MGGVWRGRERENHVFHAEECIYNLQISLSELVSLSESPLFMLSATIYAERNSLCTNSRLACKFSLSAIPSQVGIALSVDLAISETSKVVISKSQWSQYGELSQEPPDKTGRRSNS